MSATDAADAATSAATQLVPMPSATADAVRASFQFHADFPKPGINFVDIFPLFRNPGLVQQTVQAYAALIKSLGGADAILGLESRGFMHATLLSQELNVPFVPVRKAGKLPGPVKKLEYALEYGTAAIEMQTAGLAPGSKVVIVDDLLATGGTAAAAVALARAVGCHVSAVLVMVELEELRGVAKLGGVPTYTLLRL